MGTQHSFFMVMVKSLKVCLFVLKILSGFVLNVQNIDGFWLFWPNL